MSDEAQVVIPTLKKIKEGHQLDQYTVNANLGGVNVPAGTLYILRSLVEKHQVSINLGPGNMPLNGMWTEDDEESQQATE